MNIRIGNGYDIHGLVVGRPLILGGVDLNSAESNTLFFEPLTVYNRIAIALSRF